MEKPNVFLSDQNLGFQSNRLSLSFYFYVCLHLTPSIPIQRHMRCSCITTSRVKIWEAWYEIDCKMWSHPTGSQSKLMTALIHYKWYEVNVESEEHCGVQVWRYHKSQSVEYWSCLSGCYFLKYLIFVSLLLILCHTDIVNQMTWAFVHLSPVTIILHLMERGYGFWRREEFALTGERTRTLVSTHTQVHA